MIPAPGSDLNVVSPRAVADNIQLFSAPVFELAAYLQQIDGLIPILLRTNESIDDMMFDGLDRVELPPEYVKALSLVERLSKKAPPYTMSYDFGSDELKELEHLSIFERLVFYVALRAQLRNQHDFTRGSKRKVDGFAEEAQVLTGRQHANSSTQGYLRAGSCSGPHD